MPPPALTNGALPAKMLHQRTKSTPALSTLMQAGAIKAANKKVLGEANANIKLIRDDSDLGKSSPGKISLPEPVKPAAAFARPATRPLPQKTASIQTMGSITAIATQTTSEPEAAKKLVQKKSTKVLRDAPPEPEIAKPAPVVAAAPVHQVLVAPKLVASQQGLPHGLALQHQEIVKTETIPLRDEPAPRPTAKPASIGVAMPPGIVTQQREYVSHMPPPTAAQLPYQPPMPYVTNGHAPYPVIDQLPAEQYYDIDEEEYLCEDGYTTSRSFGLRGDSTGGLTTVLAPRYTDKVQKELDDARVFVEATRTPEDIEDEQWDTSMVAEYGDEIFSYMREMEIRMAPNAHYMELQTEIQWSMRSVLMDWVIQVHQRFNLLPETLFLTVNYIDRFLSCKVVSLGKLQLVGATAIFVAAKYEEVQCPTISEIIYMVDGGYSAEELLKAERFMLSMLQFELGWPGPMSFLRRISKADDYDLETRTLAKYFLEVTIMDERFVGCTPSFLAAGAHCMARLMLRKGDWTPAHVFYSNYTYSQLKQLLASIVQCCEEPQKHHAAVFEKYMDKRYKRASTFVNAEMSKGFALPGMVRGPSLGAYEVSPRW
jgi:G2/mitotic-specific cyclin 3/4